MTTLQLRKRVHEIVDRADERFLKMIVAMMSEYEEIPEYELHMTADEKKEIYRRRNDLKSGKIKGITLEEISKGVKKKLRK